jgi:hypothetical protein
VSDFKARPTVYKGIKMRSRLEAGFAMWLDYVSLEWEYEPCAFGGEKGQYLPDFKLSSVRCTWLAEPATVYVEVKPKNWPNWNDESSLDSHESLMRGMALIWESEPDAVLLLAQPDSGEPVGDGGYKVASVGILDLNWSPASVSPYPWPTVGFWALGPGDNTVGLARLLHDSKGPWPDGYWKPGR